MKRFDVHVHSMYSNIKLLDSINKPEDLVKRALEIGLRGFAITDHETVASHVKFNKLHKEVLKEHPDFKLALGNEIYLTDTRDTGIRYYHFILIAKDKIGYKQLKKLSSRAWMNSYYDRGRERVPTLKSDLVEIISKEPDHLIATSACIGGELSASVLEMEKARKIGDNETATIMYNKICRFLEFAKSVFKDDFYIECAPGASKDQIIVNQKLVQIASVYNIKMVIGSDAHYLKKEDRYVHKAYLNSQEGEREVDLFYEYAYFQDDNQIRENLSPSIVSGVIDQMFVNSEEIADKIENYDLAHAQTIPKVPVKEYPKEKLVNPYFDNMYPTLSYMKTSEDKYERYWVNECLEALKRIGHLGDARYLDELEEEARVKKIIGSKLNTNMFSYPITLQYYIDMIWECGSLVGAGRGSSCAALNHYLLGITQLDPIEWKLPFFRYMNDERVELGDIDIDICPSKKPLIIQKIKEERGKRFNEDIDELSRQNLGCVLVATFGTEATKSAILTACRGYRSEAYPDGIDNDEAQYIASLVPSERGFLWDIDDVLYGNKDKGREPVASFIKEVSLYPGLIDIIKGIVGIVNKRSSHASGVIFADEDPYEFLAYMKTPKGEIITQYDLHDSEAVGATKYDFLVTEVQDKLTQAIRFLQEDGCIEKDLSLREVYNKYFHPNVLPLEDVEVWKNIQNGTVLNAFQFDSVVGSQAAKKIKPVTILELADANGLMRLMPSEKGAETPMEKYIRYKNNIDLWYEEMDREGLTKEEQKTLEPYFLKSFGVPPSQEQLMLMLMDKNICGFDLKAANAARKIVGKKQMSKIPALKEQILASAKSPALGKYVWKFGVGPQMGYSFSIIHALAYSFIGFQTAYIATHWDPIYWDTACLAVNSGSLQDNSTEEVVSIYEPEHQELLEGTTFKDLPDRSGKIKKTAQTDYIKLAKALGEIINAGINVSLIDINKSDYGFKPDADSNQILFGMNALSGVNNEIIEQIKAGRPYSSLKDFMNRVTIKKPAMLSLIKSGAFDKLEEEWAKQFNNVHPRILSMIYYLSIISEPKKRLTLQNVNGLIEKGVFPKSLEKEKYIFYFNKELKKHKDKEFYIWNKEIDDPELAENFEIINGVFAIKQSVWDNIYKAKMDKVRDWLKENQAAALNAYNTILFKELWNKDAKENISAWEMQSLCFYYHEHELAHVDNSKYGIKNFFDLSSVPEVDKTFTKNGKQIPIFKLCRIAGTVIGKDDTKHIVSLLTTDGVVNVKFTRDYYAMYNRQISKVNADGKKSVLEKGWFTRGSKLLITGFRRDDTFVAKRYSSTPGHILWKIVSVDGSDITIEHNRMGDNDD